MKAFNVIGWLAIGVALAAAVICIISGFVEQTPENTEMAEFAHATMWLSLLTGWSIGRLMKSDENVLEGV